MHSKLRPSGGDTAFANQILAYADLSAGMRDLLDGLRALHTAEGLAGLYGADPNEAPRAEHPVVRTHDEIRRAGPVCLSGIHATIRQLDPGGELERSGLICTVTRCDPSTRPAISGVPVIW